MATTTNYGWTTPDDTALVKDGASAIRTLGSSIDTTLKAQIDAQIPDTLLSTTGDIIYASAANTPARLGIGSSGQSLVVSGGLPVWSTPASGGMTLISTTTLTGASISLSSIPSTYNELWLYIQNPRPATNVQDLAMRFNSDSTSNYRGVGSTAGSSGAKNTSNYLVIANGAANTADTSQVTVRIPNYTNTASPKNYISNYNVTDGGNTSNWYTGQNQGAWNSTAAVNTITLLPQTGSWTSGTVLLYGVK